MLSISELSFLLKNTLITSLGNASVESSFFINKEFLVENLLEESLVNLRQATVQTNWSLKSIYIQRYFQLGVTFLYFCYKIECRVVNDVVNKTGGPFNVVIDKDLIAHARLSSQRYKFALEREKKGRSEVQLRGAQKRKLDAEFRFIIENRNLVNQSISAVIEEIDEEKKRLEKNISYLMSKNC